MIEIWNESSPDHAEEHMPQEILTRLAGHVSQHPWWEARARLVARLIQLKLGRGKRRVLDVGCGWGVTLAYLEAQGHDVTGLDVGRSALQMLDSPDRHLILGDIERGPLPESAIGSFDVVLALDVLEHLDYDTAALKNLAQLVRPGGLVVVTVPARPDLWSEFDEIQGHRRRYVKEQLVGLFSKRPEFDDYHVSYCWPWLIGPARWTRRKGNESNQSVKRDSWEIYEDHVRPVSWPVRVVMQAMFRFSERRILNRGEKDGTSLMAWAYRKAE